MLGRGHRRLFGELPHSSNNLCDEGLDSSIDGWPFALLQVTQQLSEGVGTADGARHSFPISVPNFENNQMCDHRATLKVPAFFAASSAAAAAAAACAAASF